MAEGTLEMRMPPKTVSAIALSTILVIGTGLVAATTILDMRVPGFAAQNADSASAAPEPSPTTLGDSDAAPPDGTDPGDVRRAPTPAGAAATPTAPAAGAPARATSGPQVATVPVAPPPAPAPAPSPTAPVEDDHETYAPPAGDSIPPPPAGCAEAEWDREYRYWKCHADEYEEH